MTRPLPALAAALAAALALGGPAAAQQSQGLLAQAQQDRRHMAAREGQLQTPLRLPPETSGAPAPARHGRGLTVQDLASAGLDIGPDVRVFDRNRQLYGPPQARGDGVQVAPQPAVRPTDVPGQYIRR